MIIFPHKDKRRKKRDSYAVFLLKLHKKVLVINFMETLCANIADKFDDTSFLILPLSSSREEAVSATAQK